MLSIWLLFTILSVSSFVYVYLLLSTYLLFICFLLKLKKTLLQTVKLASAVKRIR